ncbi:MAG: potassium channel family protein [Mycobacteriaceae bacterium]
MTGVVFVLYFVLPFNKSAAETGLGLLIGLVVVACLLAWHARAITRATYPQVRALEGLLTTFPIFVLLFSTTYFVMDEYSRGSFSQAMTRLDALYFTVTVFSTVGFGDITALSASARIITTVQMVLDLVLVGLVVRVFYQSVQSGLARRDRGGHDR